MKRDNRKVLFIRIPENLHREIEQAAKEKGFHTKQAYIIHLLNKELEKDKVKR